MAGAINIKKTILVADGGDSSIFRPSDIMATLAVSGGSVGELMTRSEATDGWELFNYLNINRNNATGAQVVAGDVVALGANPDVVLDDTDTSFKNFVVAQQTINNGVSGRFGRNGPMTVKVTGTVTSGNYAVKAPSATSKSLKDSGVAHGSPAPSGAVGFFLTGGSGTVTAYMFGHTVAAGIPTGSMMMWPTSSAPSGWVLADGTAISRTGANAALFALLNAAGLPYGAGDGSTTFNVPNFKSRSPIGAGQGSGLSNRTLAGTGGAETHLLTTSEMPSHSHPHSHQISVEANGSTNSPSKVAATAGDGNAGTLNTQSDGANSGGGGAHNNMHPWLAINFIIKL